MSTAREHEALVAEFLRSKSKEAPELVREVKRRHPVLSRSQMERRARSEVAFSQLPKELRHVVENTVYSGTEGFDE